MRICIALPYKHPELSNIPVLQLTAETTHFHRSIIKPIYFNTNTIYVFFCAIVDFVVHTMHIFRLHKRPYKIPQACSHIYHSCVNNIFSVHSIFIIWWTVNALLCVSLHGDAITILLHQLHQCSAPCTCWNIHFIRFTQGWASNQSIPPLPTPHYQVDPRNHLASAALKTCASS